ncbi:hypothetical protein Taro_011576 [Colocasia esculenta]|uniref:Uncharacterized protein n=1 Tax=Colocasia esculenta TaxID=4460 RepID=A0A843UAJ5_COLES|nr:hypothetical protein [Colocasia esculenta]
MVSACFRVLAKGQIGVNINRRRCCVGVNPMDANTKSSVQRFKNPEEGVFGGFLGLAKESFIAILDPFGELGVNTLDAEIPGVHPEILPSTPGTARDCRQVRLDRTVNCSALLYDEFRPMASRGRRGGAPTREDEPRRDEWAEQQAPAPQGPVLPPPPPVDYGVFMQGVVGDTPLEETVESDSERGE